MDDVKKRALDPDGLQFLRLSEEECRKIHSASLEILERYGVRLHL